MEKFDLSLIDPCHTPGTKKKSACLNESQTHLDEMGALLYRMFAEGKRSLLIILQGIDASGKDGTIKHIATGTNPQGLRIYSFKEPSPEELRHDFLWRCHRCTPESGMVAIFNRSYYEEVTTVQVHPDLLLKQNLPSEILKDKNIFHQRYQQINEFEKMLAHNGTIILKFFLHISKSEQQRRLKERIKDPRKNWKFSPQDVIEREYWNAYQASFNKMLSATSTPNAPWHVIPADRKWVRNWMVSKTIVETLQKQDMKFPTLKRRKK